MTADGPLPAPRSGADPQGADLVADLLQVWRAVRRRWSVVAAAGALAAAVTTVAVFAMRPVYEGRALLLIEKVGSNALEHEGVALDSSQDDYYQTQYQILQSRSIATSVVETLKLEGSAEFAGDDPAGALQRHVRIEPVRRTRLVGIVASSRDPRLAASVANAVAAAYIEQNLTNSLFLSRDLLKTLQGDHALAAAESLPQVVNSPLIQQLKGELASLQGQYAELAQRYEPVHPKMRQLKAHLEATAAQIQREVRHVMESVKIQLSGEFKGNNVRVVDAAQVPDHPARPRKARAMALALFLGLAAGVGLALLVDRWDLTVRTGEDLETLLRVPCLAVVQLFKEIAGPRGDGYAGIWADPRSAGIEAFRNLRTAVSFRLASVKGPTVIQVTSAVQEEGKSFVAANLAHAYALAGERVLLVDGDMRRPSVHRVFGLKAELGLSSYLANGAEVPGVLPTPIPNLSVLTSGPIPDNPPELLGDRKLATLMDWAGSRYDRILVDCPPVFPVSDALLWSKHAHGVLLVVGSGQARAALVQRALHLLRESFATVLGGVLNKTAVESLAYYAYYSRYGYGYGAPPKDPAAPGPRSAAPSA